MGSIVHWAGLGKDDKYSSTYLEPAYSILKRIKDERMVLSAREMAWLMIVSAGKKKPKACKTMSTKEGKQLVKALRFCICTIPHIYYIPIIPGIY
jgi:hypothetical protein